MKSLLFVTLSRLIVIFSQLFYVKLYANYLSSHELGIYYFLTTASYSINALLLVPIDYYQQSKIYVYIKEGRSLASLVLFNKKVLIALLVVIALAACAAFPFRASYALYALLAGALAIHIYVSGALRSLMNNLEHRGLVALAMALEAVLKVVLFYILVQFAPKYAGTLIVSAILAVAVAMLPLIRSARRLEHFHTGIVEDLDGRDVFKFALPIAIGAALNWLQLQGYRMVLVPLGYAEMVGIYATVSGIGAAGMGAASAVYSQIYMPKIYQSEGYYARTYALKGALLVLAIIGFCIFFSPFLVLKLTKHEFAKYAYLMIYGVLTEAGNFLLGAMSVYLTIVRQTRRLLWVACVGAVSMLICFLALYFSGQVTTYTIGLPLAVSQLIAVAWLFSIMNEHLSTRAKHNA